MFGLVDDIDSVTNVQFLLSDYGISRIFSISFNSRQLFFCRILRLICPKMCCNIFENRLTIEKSVEKKKKINTDICAKQKL